MPVQEEVSLTINIALQEDDTNTFGGTLLYHQKKIQDMAESIDLYRLIEQIESDRTLKMKFRKALDLEDDYAKTSDIIELRDDLREEMRTGFEKVWEEIRDLREETKNLREEMKAQREEMKAQREVMNMHAISLENLWKEVRDIKLDLKETKEEVKKTHRRLDKHEEWLKSMGGSELEMKSFRWFMAVLDAKGEDVSNLRWRAKFTDPEERLGTPEIKIDVFSEKPLYVVEITNYISDIKKLMTLKKKVQFIREKFGKPKVIIITNGFVEEIEEEARDICNANGFEVFDIGWRP